MMFYEAINAFRHIVMLYVTVQFYCCLQDVGPFVLKVMLILCTEASVRSFKARPAFSGTKPQSNLANHADERSNVASFHYDCGICRLCI